MTVDAQAKRQELQAQIRQIVDTNKVKRSGEIEYRFSDGTVIRTRWSTRPCAHS